MSLFTEHGFDNVPVELICGHCGISRATFFNYFPQKQMILAAENASGIEAMHSLLQKQLMRRPKVKLRHVVSLFLAFCREHEQVSEKSRSLLLQVLTTPAGRSTAIELRKRFTASLTEVLTGMRGDPALIAQSIFSLYEGTTLEWLMDPSLSPGWLTKTMKSRLHLIAGGFDPGKRR